MGGVNFRDAYEFDPETYGGEGGGLLGRLLSLQAEQDPYQTIPGNSELAPSVPQNPNFSQTPQTRITIRPFDAYSQRDSEIPGGQSGLLGRLLTLQAEQSRYQPVPETGGRVPSAPQNPNFWQASRNPNSPSLPMPGSPAPQAETSTQQAQAQQTREAEVARLVRGIGKLTGVGAAPLYLDPIDIAKSAGIGLANGVVNAAGLPGDVLGGLGSDHLRSWRSDELRRWIEEYTGEFYQPKSRAGRYAETIGEMVPALLAGEGLGVAAGGFRGGLAASRAGLGVGAGVARGGQAAAGEALRELPGTFVKHAVAPGIAVQALEEAFPDNKVGQTLQKAYPVVRRGLPVALAAKRYLSRRIVPQ